MYRKSWQHILLILFVAVLGRAVPAHADEEFTEIDVTINIYKNSGTTKEKAKEAVKKASQILKKAKIKLNVSDTRINEGQTAGDDGSGGGTKEDGKFTDKEEDKVIAEGNKEVDGGKKGMKISFGKEFETGGAANPGISIHKQPTVLVKDRGDAQKTGETIAHEILHALTLSEQHKIDATTNSNDHGHAPDKAGDSGRGNIMAPSNYRTGSAISDDQSKKVHDDGYLDKWGKKVKKASQAAPGKKKDQQKGSKQDDLDDAPLGYLDLGRADLHSAFSESTLHGLVTLNGLFPAAGPVNANYSLLFDTDIGVPGPERGIVLNVSGDQSIAPLQITGEVFDLIGGGLPDPLVDQAIEEAIKALDVDTVPEFVQNHLRFEVDKSLLGIDSLAELALVELSSNDGFSRVDDTFFNMSLDWYLQQPDMILTQGETRPGEPVDVEIVGLAPSSPFDLFLDEEFVFTDTTNGLGEFSGAFNFPVLPANDFYFLTAIDSLGNSAFNVINLVPEPSTTALLAGAVLAGLGMLRRRRRQCT